jgi:glucokinase
VFAAARDGDDQAAAAIATVADHFGVAMANLVTVLVPERVVIGGGGAGAGELLLDPIRAAVRRHSVLVPDEWYEIVPAVLGPDAGAIGAALWAAQFEV